LLGFEEILPKFSRFCANFWRCCLDFQGFCLDFQQTKTFGGAPAPLPPTPLTQLVRCTRGGKLLNARCKPCEGTQLTNIASARNKASKQTCNSSLML